MAVVIVVCCLYSLRQSRVDDRECFALVGILCADWEFSFPCFCSCCCCCSFVVAVVASNVLVVVVTAVFFFLFPFLLFLLFFRDPFVRVKEVVLLVGAGSNRRNGTRRRRRKTEKPQVFSACQRTNHAPCQPLCKRGKPALTAKANQPTRASGATQKWLVFGFCPVPWMPLLSRCCAFSPFFFWRQLFFCMTPCCLSRAYHTSVRFNHG